MNSGYSVLLLRHGNGSAMAPLSRAQTLDCVIVMHAMPPSSQIPELLPRGHVLEPNHASRAHEYAREATRRLGTRERVTMRLHAMMRKHQTWTTPWCTCSHC